VSVSDAPNADPNLNSWLPVTNERFNGHRNLRPIWLPPQDACGPPTATHVAVLVDGAECPMIREEDGWWATVTPLQHESRYGYLVDGAGPLPDRRYAGSQYGLLPSRFSCNSEESWAAELSSDASTRQIWWERRRGADSHSPATIWSPHADRDPGILLGLGMGGFIDFLRWPQWSSRRFSCGRAVQRNPKPVQTPHPQTGKA